MLPRIICCLMMVYLSLVSQMMLTTAGPLTRHLPALVVVLAMRWFSPQAALLWAFGIGLAADALGSGALGVHAAILVCLTGLMGRTDDTARLPTVRQGVGILFVMCWCDALLPLAIAPLREQQWHAIKESLISCTVTSFVAVLIAGVVQSVIRLLVPQPRWTGGA